MVGITSKNIIFSFFSGSGFLDLGFEHAGFDIRFVNEYHQPFLEAYQYSRQKMSIESPEYGYSSNSIESFLEGEDKLYLSQLMEDARSSSDLIGFIGGPPCPDFSIGGKNKGRNGDHGKLSGAYVDLICQQKPDFFVFENVKGLWRTKRHRAFYEELKNILQREGYILAERLINTVEYGVPQDRDRIILTGFKDTLLRDIGVSVEPFLGIPENIFPWKEFTNLSKNSIFLLPWPERGLFREDSYLESPENIIKELTVEFWFSQNDVANHPNSLHYFRPKAGLKKFVSVDEGDTSKKSFKRLHRWRYSPTVCYGNNEVHLHPYKARRLSVAEALSLQSLPKEFCLPDNMSLTNMFKTIGNGVPYLAAKGLAETILFFLENPHNLIGTTSIEKQLELCLVDQLSSSRL